MVLGLCGLEDLTAFISDFGCDLQRELLLNAGYYEEAQSLDGWGSFENQSYTGSDIDDLSQSAMEMPTSSVSDLNKKD